jgi:hypothetical protein
MVLRLRSSILLRGSQLLLFPELFDLSQLLVLGEEAADGG